MTTNRTTLAGLGKRIEKDLLTISITPWIGNTWRAAVRGPYVEDEIVECGPTVATAVDRALAHAQARIRHCKKYENAAENISVVDERY